MVLTYVKNVNHLRKDSGWFIAQTASFGTMTAAFPTSFDLYLKQPYLVCSNCITELFHEFCCLFYLSQPMNINKFCDIWNNKVNNSDTLNFIQDSQSQLNEENFTNHYISTMPDQVSKKGFLNKKSNCCVSSLLHVLHYSPLPYCLAVSKEPFAATLYSLFQNMAKDTSVLLSIAELEKVTNACSMEMNLSLHQDIDELYENIVLNLIADQSIADQMKALFELKIINVFTGMQLHYRNCNKELGSSINLPIPLIGKTNIADLNSALRLFFTSQLHKSAKVCVKCSSSSDLHQFKIVKEKPEILFIVFEGNRYDFQTKTSKYIDSRVKIERDLSIFRLISETGGENKMCKLKSVVTRSGGRNINMGHFITCVFTEDEIIMHDDKTSRGI